MRVKPAQARIIRILSGALGTGFCCAIPIAIDPESGTSPWQIPPSRKKRARQNERREDINKARRSRIRTFVRKVEEAILSGNSEAALAALRAAQPELARGVTKGVLHKNTVSRKISRLAARVNALSA